MLTATFGMLGAYFLFSASVGLGLRANVSATAVATIVLVVGSWIESSEQAELEAFKADLEAARTSDSSALEEIIRKGDEERAKLNADNAAKHKRSRDAERPIYRKYLLEMLSILSEAAAGHPESATLSRLSADLIINVNPTQDELNAIESYLQEVRDTLERRGVAKALRDWATHLKRVNGLLCDAITRVELGDALSKANLSNERKGLVLCLDELTAIRAECHQLAESVEAGGAIPSQEKLKQLEQRGDTIGAASKVALTNADFKIRYGSHRP
jgi:hypothetical protein